MLREVDIVSLYCLSVYSFVQKTEKKSWKEIDVTGMSMCHGGYP